MVRAANQSWRLKAACTDSPVNLFFDRNTRKQAKAVCASCPVREACLKDTMAAEMPEEGEGVFRNRELRDGVFGGLTHTERWEKQFPKEAAHFWARESVRQEALKAAKREKYAAMTVEERRAYRGKIETEAQRDAKRARDRVSDAKRRSNAA